MHRWRVFDLISENPGETRRSQRCRNLKRIFAKTIKAVSTDIENFSFNTAIARLMELTNAMIEFKKSTELADTSLWKETVRTMLILLAPITPFISEELWETSGNKGSVHLQQWPVWDEEALVESMITLPVQVNGKLRDQIALPADVTELARSCRSL